MLLFEDLPRAGQRIALAVDQLLDPQRQLDVMAAIEPLAGSAFVRLEKRKLRLPKTQNIRLHAANTGRIANFEVEAVGDERRVRIAILSLLHGHGKDEKNFCNFVQESCSASIIGHKMHHL